MYNKELQKIQFALEHVIDDKTIVAACLNTVVAHLIKNIASKGDLTQSDFNVCLLAVDTSVEAGDDLADMVTKMQAAARENSHGAAVLSHVFVKASLYKSLSEKYGFNENTVCKVGNAVLRSSLVVTGMDALGLCQTKFDIISPQKLVIAGRLKS